MRGLAPDAVLNVSARGLTTEQVRKRFIRYRDIADGEVFFFAPASTATLFLQTLDATPISITATLAKQINKSLVASSVVSTATLQKQVNKILNTNTTTTSSLQKQVNKNLSVTVTVTATLQALKIILLTLLATVTTSASFQKQVNKILSATSTITPSLSKTVSKGLSGISTITASLQKQVNTNLSATAIITATLDTLKVLVSNLLGQPDRWIGPSLISSRGLSEEQVRKRFIRYRDIADAEVFFFAPMGIAGTLFSQALNATPTSVTATLQKQANKALNITSVITPSFVKLISKKMSTVSSITANLFAVKPALAIAHRLRISLTRFGFQ